MKRKPPLENEVEVAHKILFHPRIMCIQTLSDNISSQLLWGKSPPCRVDIYNRLYRERIIFLGSEIDDELANQIIGVMLYLDEEDSSKPIYLYINCPGGSVISGLAIFDAMQLIKSEVITINLGLAASMASFILAAGSKGKRLALPSSRIMIHQPMGGAQGQAQDIKVEAAQIMRIRDNLVKMYSMFTGQTTDQITKDLDRDNFLSAQEALEYGLVDRVLERPGGPGM